MVYTHLLDSSCLQLSAFNSVLAHCQSFMAVCEVGEIWVGNVFLSLPSFTSLNVYAYFYPGGSPCLKIPNYLRTCAFTAHTHCCSPRGKPNCPSASFQTQLCPPSYHFLSGYPMMSPLSSPSPLVLSPTALVIFPLSVSSFWEPY